MSRTLIPNGAQSHHFSPEKLSATSATHVGGRLRAAGYEVRPPTQVDGNEVEAEVAAHHRADTVVPTSARFDARPARVFEEAEHVAA